MRGQTTDNCTAYVFFLDIFVLKGLFVNSFYLCVGETEAKISSQVGIYLLLGQ